MADKYVKESNLIVVRDWIKNKLLGYAKTEDIPNVPTKVSELQNDSGYLTQHQDISGKQDKLVAGDNITITGNTISATGGGQVTKQSIIDALEYTPADDDDVQELKQDLTTKIDKPDVAPAVGKVLKVKTVNEDGTFVCEWADGGGAVDDVTVSGSSIVTNGVADIPVCTSTSAFGLVRTNSAMGITVAGDDGSIQTSPATSDNMKNHYHQYRVITPSNFDEMLRYGMGDGKAPAWTESEQVSARERIGAVPFMPVQMQMYVEEHTKADEATDNHYINTNSPIVYAEILVDRSGATATRSGNAYFGFGDKSTPAEDTNLYSTAYIPYSNTYAVCIVKKEFGCGFPVISISATNSDRSVEMYNRTYVNRFVKWITGEDNRVFNRIKIPTKYVGEKIYAKIWTLEE